MEVDSTLESIAPQPPQIVQQPLADVHQASTSQAAISTTRSRDTFRDIAVKVHIRRPGKDSWVYLGRALVTQEIVGQTSRVVVRSTTNDKVMTSFHESCDLQAEKRGNFVVIGCIENSRVVSWSLNALNNSETLRLLASIELACYKCKQAIADPRMHTKIRRRVAHIIKEDRKKRHRRRKDQDALTDAFAKQNLEDGSRQLDPDIPTDS